MDRRRRADTIVAYKLNRISRSAGDFLHMKRTVLDPNGAEFVSVTENFDTTTALGRAMLTIAVAFGELESDMKSEIAIDAHVHMKAEGRATTGPRPVRAHRRPQEDRGSRNKRESVNQSPSAYSPTSRCAPDRRRPEQSGRCRPRPLSTVKNKGTSARSLVADCSRASPAHCPETTVGLREIDGVLVFLKATRPRCPPCSIARPGTLCARAARPIPHALLGEAGNSVVHLLTGDRHVWVLRPPR